MNRSAHILLVDDDEDLTDLVAVWLAHAGYRVDVANDGGTAIRELERKLPDVVVLDVHMPGLSGIETLERLRKLHPSVPVLMLTAETDPGTVVEAMHLGVYDYLVKPVDEPKLKTAIRNSVERARMSQRLVELERTVQGTGYRGIIGESSPMQELFRQMDRLTQADVSVLIHGESGTGKELVARAIHDSSARSSGPFVALNCAAIAETLQESELFGHEKGAFTGASERRIGKFELANGGTLFLDEVGELSPGLQAKLLRVLQERRFSRVGGNAEIPSDFRLLAASHRDLQEMTRANRFREDLYFRIAVYELDVPPLRERTGDVPRLSAFFLQSHAGPDAPTLDDEVTRRLESYAWPGNVRELENAIARALVSCEAGVVTLRDLPRHIASAEEPRRRPSTPQTPPASVAGALPSHAIELGELSLEEIERIAIETTFDVSGGNVSETCRILGISRTTFYRKLDRYGLKRSAARLEDS